MDCIYKRVKRFASIGGLLATMILTACTTSTTDNGDPSIVATAQGKLQGTVSTDVRSFLGIPFAAPPVGALRWHAPQPPAAWNGVRDATQFGNRCPQFSMPLYNAASADEDCLYLNVYTPTTPPDQPWPVMVWIHGGTWTEGAGSDYDGSALAAKHGVVVVTINYRLGPFGALAFNGLRDAKGSSGSYNLLDQQAALHWVHDNIASFGGNPDNVTLFGESAGSASVCDHLASPLSAGLFQKAIGESAPCTAIFVSKPQRMAESFAAQFAARPSLNCTGSDAAIARCMMNKSTTDILNAMNGLEQYAAAPTAFVPTVEGYALPQAPVAAINSGSFNKVPMISGTNHDEGRLLSAIIYDDAITPIVLNQDTYVQAMSESLSGLYPGLGNLPTIGMSLIAPLYPLSQYQTPAGYDPYYAPAHLAASAVQTDSGFSCAEIIDNELLLQANTDLYMYEFSDPAPPANLLSPYMPLAASHTTELTYVFQGDIENGAGTSSTQFTAQQQALSDQMQTYWTNFATTGDPNGPGLPAWPKYSGTNGQLLTLAPGSGGVAPMSLSNFSSFHKCGYWMPLLNLSLGL